MQAAILLFDRFTALDAVTAHAALSRAGIAVTFVGPTIGPVRGESRSIELTADAALDEVPAPDIIVIPGGAGVDRHLVNGAVHKWLRAAEITAAAVITIGTGTLISAAAGILAGRRVAANDTTSAFVSRHRALPAYEPAVIDGKYGTAVDAAVGGELVRDLLDRLSPPHRSITTKGDGA